MIKTYTTASRLKLDSLWDVMLGNAVITDQNIHRDEVVFYAVISSLTKEDMTKTIKLTYEYFYGTNKNVLTLIEWMDYILEIKKKHNERWWLDGKGKRLF